MLFESGWLLLRLFATIRLRRINNKMNKYPFVNKIQKSKYALLLKHVITIKWMTYSTWLCEQMWYICFWMFYLSIFDFCYVSLFLVGKKSVITKSVCKAKGSRNQSVGLIFLFSQLWYEGRTEALMICREVRIKSIALKNLSSGVF